MMGGEEVSSSFGSVSLSEEVEPVDDEVATGLEVEVEVEVKAKLAFKANFSF